MEKRELLCTIRNVSWCGSCGKQYGGSQKKPKNRIALQSSNSASGHRPQKVELGSQGVSAHLCIHSIIIHKGYNIEQTSKRVIKKEGTSDACSTMDGLEEVIVHWGQSVRCKEVGGPVNVLSTTELLAGKRFRV